ncbi:ImmA/IrrE family metallo-endopeptidase [Flavobacterium sp. CYK-55]|uniref:XRE family transcriptional regulator n=1 Tax=Flavobacterium sp. CYK-55 TaxID=2835529 RepID=UPI001BCC0032|nr:XRE family transcriptional regulator [Flavobacterium sp. CYK-55]MBS7787685.1 ImmA/IrrE family metallo-endopeptidase [Flavobacterium sp. CYK-55]
MAPILDNELLRLARTYKGKSQKDFSEDLGVSQSLISGIEKSTKPLSEDIVSKLQSEFGQNFFKQKLHYPQLKVYYRASANIPKKYTDLFESRLQIIANHISILLEAVEIPENKIPLIDLEDFNNDAEYLANEIRDYFGLGRKPIEDIVRLLEKSGVVIFFYDFDFISSQNKHFDGVSFYVNGVPVILINDKIQNARKVFTICHELLHLIAHNHSQAFLSKERDIEKEANQFASEFIAPKSALRGEFTRLSFDKLFELKAYWKISIGALLYKAKETVLTAEQYKRWATAFSRYRKNEPNDFEISKPVLLKKMFDCFESTLDENEDFHDELYISKKVFDDIYGTLNDGKSKAKMRIVM